MLYKIDKADKTDKSSLQGVLPKDIYKVNGSYFIVKGNSSGNVEPISEVLGSRIFRFLTDYPVIESYLVERDNFPEVNGDYDYASMSKKFKYKLFNYSKHMRYLNKLGKISCKFDFDELFKYFSLDFKQYYAMLVCDAVIGNKDRRNNNYDVYYDDNGIMKLAPILDFGQSLLFDIRDYALPYTDLEDEDKSNPLCKTHKEQIKYLINTYGIIKCIKCTYNGFEDFVLNKNDDIFSLVSDIRSAKIKEYLISRYKKYAEQFEVGR